MWHCHPLQAQCDKYWKYTDHKTKRGSIARKGRVKEETEVSSPHSSSRTRALCYRCHVLAAPHLPCLASWKVTSAPKRTCTLFLSHSAPKHHQHPTSCWDMRWIQSLLQGGEERWGSHSLPARSSMGYPKNRRGWFGQHMAWGYFAQSKAKISVHTPTTHPEKGQHEFTAMETHTNSTEL